jgi:hypothetical protein
MSTYQAGRRGIVATVRQARIERMLAAAVRCREEEKPESEWLDRRIAALQQLARSDGQAWAHTRWSKGAMQWRREQLRRWHIPRGLRLLATPFAALFCLARWEELHADDGYAEPPGNIWRIVRLWRQARWGFFGTALMAACATAATWAFVLRPTFPPAHADIALLAAAVWLIVLSLPGELPMSLRGPVRMLIWAAEFVLWVGFDQVDGKSSGIVLNGVARGIVEGVRYSAIADLFGLILIALLIWARDWPLRAVQQV